MADRGIAFSDPMVRALLDGRKTQTRRIIKPQPTWQESENISGFSFGAGWCWGGLSRWTDESAFSSALSAQLGFTRGDRLYVREAYYQFGHWEPVEGVLTKGGRQKWEFSRMFLVVTDVRVERVAAISEADAIAEGIERHPDYPQLWRRGPLIGDQNKVDCTAFPKLAFRSIWEGLHKANGERWEDSPWVVAITFDLRHGNIDEVAG